MANTADDRMVLQKRITFLDIAKGITILSVTFNHCLGVFISNSEMISPRSMQYVSDIVHQFNMPLFFLVAGIFSLRSLKKGLRQALMSRFMRLAIPYFTWGFLFAIFKQIGGNLANNPAGLKDFLMSPIVPWAVFWFLYVLLFIYVIFALIIRLLGERHGQILLLIISIAAFMLKPFMPHVYIIPELCQYTIFFCIGSCLPNFIRTWDAQMRLYKFSLSILLFAAVFVVFVNFDVAGNERFLHYYQLLTSFAGINLIFSLSWVVANYTERIFEILNFFGQKSMEVYVSHSFVIGVLRVILQKIFGTAYLWERVFVMFVATVVIMYVIWKCIPKSNKTYRLMFGITEIK